MLSVEWLVADAGTSFTLTRGLWALADPPLQKPQGWGTRKNKGDDQSRSLVALLCRDDNEKKEGQMRKLKAEAGPSLRSEVVTFLILREKWH
jgi:hypothetical protein